MYIILCKFSFFSTVNFYYSKRRINVSYKNRHSASYAMLPEKFAIFKTGFCFNIFQDNWSFQNKGIVCLRFFFYNIAVYGFIFPAISCPDSKGSIGHELQNSRILYTKTFSNKESTLFQNRLDIFAG